MFHEEMVRDVKMSRSVESSVDPLVIKGEKFFYKTNGTQFYLKGANYNAIPESAGNINSTFSTGVFSDKWSCTLSVPVMQSLGINVISITDVDLSYDQTFCMDLLANAGIYVLVYLESISTSSTPAVFTSMDYAPAWTTDKFASYTSVVDTFSSYTNVLGFVVANRVQIFPGSNTETEAFVKAATRDIKSYLTTSKYRQIPVGYGTLWNHTQPDIYPLAAEYLTCGNSTDITIDFWGLDLINSWCNTTEPYSGSDYENATTVAKGLSIPSFVSSYGCQPDYDTVTVQGVVTWARSFNETAAIYGSDMSSTWSGGLVNQWEGQATNNDDGLVDLTYGNVTLNPDYTNYGEKLAAASPTAIQVSSYSPMISRKTACPTLDSSWQAAAQVLPPTPNKDVCSCMISSLSCSVQSSMSLENIQPLYETLCAQNSTNCIGTQADSKAGVYGAYSICTQAEQLSWAINRNYLTESTRGNTSSCTQISNFAKFATPSPLTSQCATLVNNAGVLGDGVPISNNSSSKKLGGGAIAGIVIGVLALLVFIAIGIFSLWKRRATKKRNEMSQNPEEGDIKSVGTDLQGPSELAGGEGAQKVEMWTQQNTSEMPGEEIAFLPAMSPVELPASEQYMDEVHLSPEAVSAATTASLLDPRNGGKSPTISPASVRTGTVSPMGNYV